MDAAFGQKGWLRFGKSGEDTHVRWEDERQRGISGNRNGSGAYEKPWKAIRTLDRRCFFLSKSHLDGLFSKQMSG